MERKLNVVITGSSRGIGFGLASQFLENGHNVLINSTNLEKLNIAFEKLKKFSDKTVGLAFNVNEPDFVNRAFELMNAKFGDIDIWINNAGIPQPYKIVSEIDDEFIEKQLKTNLISVINISKKVYSKMNESSGGKIFNMEGFGSNGRMGYKMSIYGTSKNALTYFTKSFAKEIGGEKIQINRLNPGMVVTDFLNLAFENSTEEEKIKTKKVFNMLGSEVDEVVKFLYKGIIKSKKNNDSINYLTTIKLLSKLIKNVVSPRNYFKIKENGKEN